MWQAGLPKHLGPLKDCLHITRHAPPVNVRLRGATVYFRGSTITWEHPWHRKDCNRTYQAIQKPLTSLFSVTIYFNYCISQGIIALYIFPVFQGRPKQVDCIHVVWVSSHLYVHPGLFKCYWHFLIFLS